MDREMDETGLTVSKTKLAYLNEVRCRFATRVEMWQVVIMHRATDPNDHSPNLDVRSSGKVAEWTPHARSAAIEKTKTQVQRVDDYCFF